MVALDIMMGTGAVQPMKNKKSELEIDRDKEWSVKVYERQKVAVISRYFDKRVTKYKKKVIKLKFYPANFDLF